MIKYIAYSNLEIEVKEWIYKEDDLKGFINKYEDKSNLIEYVISKVRNEEYIKLLNGINLATDAIIEIMKNSIDEAMNKFN